MTGSVDAGAGGGRGKRPNGAQWLEAWKAAQDPWFNFTSGNGFYSTDKYWIDHLDIPLGYMRDYIVAARARARTSTGRPPRSPPSATASPTEYADIARRGRARRVRGQARPRAHRVPLCREPQLLHRALVDGRVLAEDARAEPHPARRRLLARRRTACSISTARKCATRCATTAMPGPSARRRSDPHYWPAEIARRRKIMAALATQPPQPALNEPPDVITEPFTIMLWGITTESVGRWLERCRPTSSALTGMAASPGHRRGPRARAALGRRSRPDRRGRDSGHAGHGAELGAGVRQDQRDRHRHRRHDVPRGDRLPRIRPAGRHRHRQCASSTIKTGQLLRVDGITGEVTILS